ncbi:MAG: HAD family phosphatase [Pseudomonadota bacterium]
MTLRIDQPMAREGASLGGALCLEAPALVVFDFDGVIADSEVISLSSLQQTLGTFGVDLSIGEVRRRYLGVGTDKILRDVESESPQRTAAGFREAWQKILFARFRAELTPVHGAQDLLARIAEENIPYCIASSGSFERIGIALEAMKLTDRFEHVFSAEQVRNGKPAPDLFLLAAQEMRVNPEDCVVIEDSLYGVAAAKQAGMRAIGFLGGKHLTAISEGHRSRLLEAGADCTISRFDELVFG